ncbi:condensation domain-containing protein, partial [Niastella populi]|uniref:condensation domain-containing protein n=1 Tax=Niastella populi TaxID=550983 RepID=UPI001F618AA7
MDKLISHLLQNGIYLSKKGDKLSVEYNGDMISDDLLKEIKNNKDELLRYLGRENINPDYQDIIPVKNAESYSLSNAQRRLWVLSQFEGVSAAYNMPGRIYLNQEIDIENFKRAIDSVIERHEILRTVFKEDKTGKIRQWVLGKEDFSFEIGYKDFRQAQNKEEKVKEYITEDSYKNFDLVNGPLLRAALLRVEDSMYVFCYNMHHIISDGWSLNVLSKDIFSYYNAYKENKQPQKKKLRIHYKDYSAWQLAQLNEKSFIAHRRYWLDSLSGELPTIDLPGTKQRPQIKTSNGQGLTTYIGSEATDKLKKYSQASGGSLFMGLLAVWNILVYRYTSQKDIIIGTPVAGREHTELEDQIGFYVNMLALRIEVDPDESFHGFYKSLKEDILNSYSHQMYPFDCLVEELNLQRDASRSAVFDVLLDFHDLGDGAEELELSKEGINQIVDLGYRTSKFDIEV